jgi:hypothetical protein
MSAIVMTFGRFNPPTTGHQLLVDKMSRIMVPFTKTDHFIYLSPTTGKNNPLDFDYRRKLLSKAFMANDIIVSDIKHKDVFDAVKWAYELGYAELHLVVGGDRYEELKKRIPMYNGKLYKFTLIHVYNAGDRDDSDGIEGMSASRMREAAKLGDYETFESGLPNKLRSMSRDIYERVREACRSESSLQRVSSF